MDILEPVVGYKVIVNIDCEETTCSCSYNSCHISYVSVSGSGHSNLPYLGRVMQLLSCFREDDGDRKLQDDLRGDVSLLVRSRLRRRRHLRLYTQQHHRVPGARVSVRRQPGVLHELREVPGHWQLREQMYVIVCAVSFISLRT